MLIKGAVFHKQDFEYIEAGKSQKKFLVLLNTPAKSDPCFVAPVTSQQHGKSTMPGCCDIHAVFFLPENTECFKFNTWLQLFYVKEYERKKLEHQQNGTTYDSNKKPLSAKTMSDIIDCLFKVAAEDLTTQQKRYLKPTVSESAKNLRDFFSKRKNK